jgi:hypothetical protein
MMLDTVRSTLTVKHDAGRRPYLAHRTEPAAEAAAELAMKPEDNASKLLKSAWKAQYDLHKIQARPTRMRCSPSKLSLAH